MSGVNNQSILKSTFDRNYQFFDELKEKLDSKGKRVLTDRQREYGAYSDAQVNKLKTLNVESFRDMVNYVNPKNKGAARFKSDMTLERCNNQVDVGSWRIGLNAKKNKLMRATFAHAIAPGLKYIADEKALDLLMSKVTGTKKDNWKGNGEIVFDQNDFSTKHLERKDIREAIRVYDDAFNTPLGRMKVISTMIKNEINGTLPDDSRLNPLTSDKTTPEAFMENLASQLSLCLGMDKGIAENALREMLEEKPAQEKKPAQGKDAKDAYVDRHDAMAIKPDEFLSKMNDFKNLINLFAKEGKVAADLVPFLRNAKAAKITTPTDALRNLVSSMLPDSVSNFLGVKKGEVNRELTAFNGNFGGRKPLDIFMDKQFGKMFAALLKKYEGKLDGSADTSGVLKLANDIKVAKAMVNDMVEIAAGFVKAALQLEGDFQKSFENIVGKDKYPELKPKSEKNVQPEEPQVEVQEGPKSKVINLDMSEAALEKLGLVKDGKSQLIDISKDLENFEKATNFHDKMQMACQLALAIGMKEVKGTPMRVGQNLAQNGVELGYTERKSINHDWPGIVLDSMVSAMAENLDKSKFFADIKERETGSKPNIDGWKNQEHKDEVVYEVVGTLFASETRAQIQSELRHYETKMSLCAQLGKLEPKNGEGKLTNDITNALESVLAIIEDRLGPGVFKSLRRFFQNKAQNAMNDVATEVFKQQVVSTLISRFYNEKIAKLANAANSLNRVSAPLDHAFEEFLPLMLFIEKMAGDLYGILGQGDTKFDELMKSISAKSLNISEEAAGEIRGELAQEYRSKLTATLQSAFKSFNFSSLKVGKYDWLTKAIDNNKLADESENLVKDFQKGLKTDFKNSVQEIAGSLADKCRAVNSDFNTIFKSYSKEFGLDDKGTLTLREGKDIVNKFEVSFQLDKDSKLSLDAKKLLVGDKEKPGVLTALFKKLSGQLAYDTYRKYVKAAKSDKNLNAATFAVNNDIRKIAADYQQKIIQSMLTFVNRLCTKTVGEVRDGFNAYFVRNKYFADKAENLTNLSTNRFFADKFDTLIFDHVARQLTRVYSEAKLDKLDAWLDGVNADKTDSILPGNEISAFVRDYGTKGEEVSLRAREYVNNVVNELGNEKPAVPANLAGTLFDDLIAQLKGEGDSDEDYLFVQIMSDDSIGTKNETDQYKELNKKYGFLRKFQFKKEFFSDRMVKAFAKAVDACTPLEIGILGVDGFKRKITEAFDIRKSVRDFRNYVDECMKQLTDNPYGFTDAEVKECLRNAIWSRDVEGGDKKNDFKYVFADDKFSVEDAKRQYDREIGRLLMQYVGKIQNEKIDAFSVFKKVQKHVQKRVDDLSDWWQQKHLVIREGDTAQHKFATHIQKNVLKKFNAKFVMELVNQVWLKDDLEDKVKSDIRNGVSYEKNDAFNTLLHKDFGKRVETMLQSLNTVVFKVMDGIYEKAGYDSGLKDLVENSLKAIDGNPALAGQLQSAYEQDAETFNKMLTDNIDPFYEDAINAAVDQYWNTCCNNKVFDDLNKAVGLKIQSVKPPVPDAVKAEEPVKPVEAQANVQPSAEEKQPASGEKQPIAEKQPVAEKPSVPGEKPVPEEKQPVAEEKPVIGEFTIDLNKQTEKIATLKEVVVQVLKTGVVAREIQNVQGKDFEELVRSLDDDNFIKDIYSRVVGEDFPPEVWNDIKDSVRKSFVERHYQNLKDGIRKAFDPKTGKISFQATEIDNSMFSDAYDTVLRARWQARMSSVMATLSTKAKDGMVSQLSEFLGIDTKSMPTMAEGDDPMVTQIFNKRQETLRTLLKEVVMNLPLEYMLRTPEDQHAFLRSGTVLSGDNTAANWDYYLAVSFPNCLTRMLNDPQRYLDGVAEELKNGTAAKRETLAQHLAFFKDYNAKSIDRIVATRTSLGQHFVNQYVTKEGFANLFMSDLFMVDKDISKFKTFGLDENKPLESAVIREARKASEGIANFKKGPGKGDKVSDSRQLPAYLTSHEAFYKDMMAVQGKVANATEGSATYKAAKALFGTVGGSLTATIFANVRKQGVWLFAKETMMGKINNFYGSIAPVFQTAIKAAFEQKVNKFNAEEELLNSRERMAKWRADRTKEELAKIDGYDSLNQVQRLVHQNNIARKIAQEEHRLVNAHLQNGDLGFSTEEVNEICGKVLGKIVALADMGSKDQKYAATLDELTRELSAGNVLPKTIDRQISTAVKELAEISQPTQTGSKRDSFSGFVQRYAILKAVIETEERMKENNAGVESLLGGIHTIEGI